MATFPKNRVTRSVAPKSLFESAKSATDVTVSYNQGDLMYFDSTAHLLKALDSDAHAAFAAGSAKVTVSLGKMVGPYAGLATDAASAVVDLPGPAYGVVAKMILKTGDAFNPGDKVYYGGDAQTVSSTGTNPVGLFQGSAVSSAFAGQEGECLLGAAYGMPGLVF